MNNSFEIYEAFGVGVIICIQAYNFYKTNRQIAVYRRIFPEDGAFGIIRPFVRKEALGLHSREVLSHLDQYTVAGGEEGGGAEHGGGAGGSDGGAVQVELIRQKVGGGNAVTQKIIYSLNTYLLRNKGVASDFHLIKDVVERNCDSVEEDIHQTVSLPLYLGLLGTFLGIVIGLIQIANIDLKSAIDNSGGQTSALDIAISALLKGVLIAMVASFFGLLLTVLNSGVFFKGAKGELEGKRNDFYTFIQTDLLPLLNQNINSTLFSLQSNLHKFNEEFKSNVGMLSSVMGKNHQALLAQEKILTTLDNMDITAFGKANVLILQELNVSTEKLAQFNHYLEHMTELVRSTKQVSSQLGEAIGRSDNFNALGQKLVGMFEENQRLVEFLQSHYNSLDESHQLITQSVNRVGSTLDESLDRLRQFTQDRISEIQKITLREMDLLQNQYPEKWKRLDSLTFLETMNKHLSEMKMSSASQIGRLDTEVREMSGYFKQAVSELEQIRMMSNNRLGNRLSGWFRRLTHKKQRKHEDRQD